MVIRKIIKEDLIEIEKLIKDTILKINSKDYSKWVIDFMLSIDPFRPRNTRHERDYFITFLTNYEKNFTKNNWRSWIWF